MIRSLLRRQTLASFDYQWRELPEGGGLLSDEWFNDNAVRIISEELLCVRADWFRGKRILDAGCGSGRWTVGLLRLGADVVATDVSEHALGYARENVATLCSTAEAARFHAVRANLLDLPAELRTERFDCVFSFGVLHHTGDTRRALANVARLVGGEDGVVFLYLYGRESVGTLARLALASQRYALAPLPFAVKRRVVAALRRGADVHQSFDLLSPTINDRYTFVEVAGWLHDLGFDDVARTADHSELFIRALRRTDTLAEDRLPPPERPYWFERYG